MPKIMTRFKVRVTRQTDTKGNPYKTYSIALPTWLGQRLETHDQMYFDFRLSENGFEYTIADPDEPGEEDVTWLP